ncbi:MAG: thioredoxin [Rickettsiaceae bacterium]|jgi:thiol-disulfide isomerase/thioredoxin|nr:thioredoxin [Rickettsiaceae bacterium]
MIAAILIVVTILSTIIWNRFIQNPNANFYIPESDNKTYHQPESATPSDVISQIENNLGKPVLLFVYTTWCGVCKQQLPIINEMARKFQKTDLKIISVAIDKNIDAAGLIDYLQYYQNIYFPPQYLLYTDGLGDLLKQKNIKYNKIIPLTVLIDREGEIETRFTGNKSEHYLNSKIIKTLAKTHAK